MRARAACHRSAGAADAPSGPAFHGVHFGLRFCTKAVLPSMPSSPLAARANTPAASCTRSAGGVNRALAIKVLVAATACGAHCSSSCSVRASAASSSVSACTACTEADRECGLRVELAAAHRETLGLGVAEALDEIRRDLRRHHADRRFGQAEHGARAGDRHVGHAGEAEAAAHHRAFDHRHGGHRQRGELRAHLAEAGVGRGHRMKVARAAGHRLQVGAGAEVPTRAAQHYRTHVARIRAHAQTPRAGRSPSRATSHCAPRAGSA